MHIGLYLGSWNLASLGGMGTYVSNLFQAVERITVDQSRRSGPGGDRPRFTALVDRVNRNAAAELGLDCEVVTLDRPRWADVPVADRRRVIAVRKQSYRNLDAADARRSERWSDAAAQYLWGLDEAVRAAEIDLLYFPLPPYLKRPRVPVLLTIHDLKHLHRPQDHERADLARRRRWQAIAKSADLVISSYEHIRSDVVHRLDVPQRSTAILPLAAPDGLRRTARNKDSEALRRFDVALAGFIERPFALLPAQFWIHKNHALVFLALAKLRNSHGLPIPLVCTGQTDAECAEHAARMRSLILRLGIGDLAYIAGHVPAVVLRELYERARMVLAPTLYDPGSFPVMEALALGKPLVASRVTSIPETVGDAGVLFDPGNLDELCDALRTVWNDDQLRATLALRGPARITKRTWHDVAVDWLRLCHKAVETNAERHLSLVTR